MADKKARYVGPSQTGVDLAVPLANGMTVETQIKQGGELPSEIDGVRVDTKYRDSLLEQSDNWTEVKRATGAEATGTTKEGDK